MNFPSKQTLLLGYFLFLFVGVHSQNSLIDSLKFELSNHQVKDSTRVNILNELAYGYYRKDINITLSYLDESEEIAETIGYQRGKARVFYLRGVAQMVQANFDQALSHVQNAIQIYGSLSNLEDLASCYNLTGSIYHYKGDYQEAITFYKKSLKICEDNGYQEKITSVLINIGNPYAYLGNYPEAISHYERALEIYTELDDQDGISKCLNNLGTVYDDLGNYPLALDYYFQSFFLYKKMDDSLGISNSLNNLGSIYSKKENYSKALEFYTQSLVILEKNNRRRNIVGLKKNIGVVYKNQLDYQTALKFFFEAIELGQEIDAPSHVSSCLNNVGAIYLSLDEISKARDYYEEAEAINLEIDDQLGLSASQLGIAETYLAEQQYEIALTYTLKGKKISDEIKGLDLQSRVEFLLFNIYKGSGDYPKALASHEKYKTLEDSLFNKKNIEKMAQIEYEYKYKEELESANNREIKLTKTVKSTTQDLENSQRNAFIAIIVMLLISIVSGGIIFYQKLKNANAINQNILVEQKLLRSQMTPHFIFNSLSVLQGMILNKEEAQSISYLSKFSKLLRTVLENSRHKTVSLHKELSAVNNYMELQNLSVHPPYEYHLKIESAIHDIAFKIPPMLIQPFIENATEHAFPNKREDKRIEVEISFVDQKLICIISDNGVGLKTNRSEIRKPKNSLATTITSERLATLSKYFEVQGSVDIQDRESLGEQGTLVTLVIPYKIDLV